MPTGTWLYLVRNKDIMVHFLAEAMRLFLKVGALARYGVVGVLILMAGRAAAQAPAWQLAVPVGGTVTATTTDAAGNLYVAGYFSGTLVLGPATLVSAGGTDAFVAKWSALNGSFSWAQRAGGAGPDQALGLAAQGTRVYVGGSFAGPATFGGLSLPGRNSVGNTDGFVARLDDTGLTGSFAWALPAGDEVRAVVARGSAVYVAGNFSNTAVLGGSTVVSAGYYDMFVARLSDAGAAPTFAWAQRGGGPDLETTTALAVTPAGGVFVTGYYVGAATFGATTLPNAGSYDAFVTKLTDTGTSATYAWAQTAGGAGTDQAFAIAVNGTSVYVAGTFTDAATFGSFNMTNGAAGDAFVAKLTDAGPTAAYTWVKRGGGGGTDAAVALAVNGPNVYVGGYVGGGASFGAFSPLAAGRFDAFVARLTDAGPTATYTWALVAGGPGDDVLTTLALAPTGPLYLAGAATAPATFGPLALASGPAGSSGNFVAALAVVPLATAPAAALAGLSVFPNPAHGQAAVLVPAAAGGTPATLVVLDALGRPVRTQAALPATRAVLDLTGLAPGLYAVRLTVGAATATRRLVVE